MKNDFAKLGYGALRSMLQRQQPLMKKLAEYYGSADPDELMKLAFEANQQGAPLKALTEEEECGACRDYAEILMQALALKELIPGFDLDEELTDPRFGIMIMQPPMGAGLSLEDAYHALHRRELEDSLHRQQLQLAGYAARSTARKLAAAIMSGGMRPNENGMNAAAAAYAEIDPRRLSPEERADIRRRVNSGEKIRW